MESEKSGFAVVSAGSSVWPGPPSTSALKAEQKEHSHLRPRRIRALIWSIPVLNRIGHLYGYATGSPSTHLDNSNGEKRRSWTTSLIRFGPLSGLLALLSAVLSIIASLGVLAGSNRTPVATWPTPPSTFIAIFTALGNLSVRYAAFQGVIITWWLKALHGSTVGRLHYDWRTGTSIRGAITAGRRMGWLGIACICSTLVVIDGPLLQRASTVVDAQVSTPVSLQWSMVPSLPIGYSGFWVESSGVLTPPSAGLFNNTMPGPDGPVSTEVFPSGPEDAFDQIIGWWKKSNGPYPLVIQGCPDGAQCIVKLIAPAVAVKKCVTHSSPRNYTNPWPTQEEWGEDPAARPFDTEAFIIANALVVDGPQEQINTVMGYSTTENCVGTYNYTFCTLESAIGEYDVMVDGDAFYLNTPVNPKILAIAEAPVIHDTFGDGQHKSTLGGAVNVMTLNWQAFASITTINNTVNSDEIGEQASNLVIVSSATGGACNNYEDPFGPYMASLNSLMVYFGVAATQGVRWGNLDFTESSEYPSNGTTTGHTVGRQSVFRTSYAFFAGAVLVELVCICLIAPTYWGWWRLGRSVSFSPLEIAKGFEAPLLADSNSNATGRDMANAHLNEPIRYGALSADGNGGRSRLAFVSPDVAHAPEQRSYYDV